MATITGTQSEKVFQIKQWLGVNLSPYGDTKLKMGEAAVMRNFRVTRDGNLQKRPGSKITYPVPTTYGSMYGAWSGIAGGKECALAVFGDTLMEFEVISDGTWTRTDLVTLHGAPLDPDDRTYRPIFGFEGNAYIIGYDRMYCYNGLALSTVTPYVPLVLHGMDENGAGTTLEQVNKLTPKRRVWLSPPNNAGTVWKLPESFISVDYAKKTSNGDAVAIASYDALNGTFTFSSAPGEGIDSIEVGYTAYDSTGLPLLDGMKYVELYNGDQLNRAFAYGNGTNQAYYTGLDYNGRPDASYWPDLNVVSIGDSGEQITNMIRYNSRLVAFTDNSTYSVQYGQYTKADGSVIAAFYTVPVHKSLGSDVPGTAQMVMNTPVVIHNNDVYSWSGNKFGNMSADERQAKRISDRVQVPLSDMEIVCCYDDNYNQEYYICGKDGTVLVWNYARDVWYLYEGIYAYYMFSMGNMTCFFSNPPSVPDLGYPGVLKLDEAYPKDDISPLASKAIDCYWESGSMSFGIDYQRKYSAMLWVGVMPAHHASVYVTAKTDRSSELTEKLVAHWYSTFHDANFGKWSFNTSHRPRLKRLKIKAKKFVYYKLIFKSTEDDTTAVITTADIRVRFTGYAK